MGQVLLNYKIRCTTKNYKLKSLCAMTVHFSALNILPNGQIQNTQ